MSNSHQLIFNPGRRRSLRISWGWLSEALLLGIALGVLAGCAEKPAQPPAKTNLQPAVSNATVPTASAEPPKAPGDRLKAAAALPLTPFEGDGWRSMFDGHSLAGWRETQFAGHGQVECESGLLVMNMGDPFTGLNWTNDLPNNNYEVALDAMRLSGSDFFCGLTVPVRDSFCSLIVGGWGGGLVGISSLNGMDASENETTKFTSFEQGRWYRIRLRITDQKIEGWIDKDKLIDAVITDKKISLRPGDIEMSKPFGIACWQTTAALREIKIRNVDGPASPPK